MATLPALKKLKKFIERNPLEAIDEPTGIVKGVGESLRKDVLGKGTGKKMWEQILNVTPREGDMHPGQEVDLRGVNADSSQNVTENKAKKLPVEAGNNYHREILHYAEKSNNRETSVIQNQVQQIVIELQRLVDSSSDIIKAEFGDITMTQAPAEVGNYHVNFFEWMLNVIQNARMKVEDSGAWLATMQGKKGKRNYWSMFKKHGTSFAMSNERQVATQSG